MITEHMTTVCQVCFKRKSEHLHHLFSQTKWAKKLYPDYIHDSRNLLPVCSICHLNKPIPKFTEKEFCIALGINTRSKINRTS